MSVEPSTGTSKRSQGEASTTALASSAMPYVEEAFVDSTAVVDPTSGAEDVDPTVTPSLSLYAIMQSFITTLAAHGQLLDELLTEVASLRSGV